MDPCITWVGRVENCYISDNAGDGIRMDDGGAVTIRDNTVCGSGNTVGIRVVNHGLCHVEGNVVTGCQTGIVVGTTSNTVVRNSGITNGISFSIAPGNLFAPAVTPGTVAAATNPLANYSN